MYLESGQIIDNKYRIVRLLGEGGMGAVYEGQNVRIRRRVAIKVLTAKGDEALHAIERFEREAQAAGQIGSDHIMEVYDLGELENGDRFMVIEYLDGETLNDRLARTGPMKPENLVPLARQICRGLSAAHAAGIIHRDLKPENIFVLNEKAGQQDFVKLIDFGISKFQTLSDNMKVTRTGTVMGTPYYMSPEQANGTDIDPRSDVYALGIILYEALAGQVPFDAPSFTQLIVQIVMANPVPIHEKVPGIDEDFAAIVHKAMARNADERYASAEQLSDAMDAWLHAHEGTSAGAPTAAAHVPAPQAPTAYKAATPASTLSPVSKLQTEETSFEVPTRSKTPLYIAAAVALLAGGAVTAFALAGSDDAASTAQDGTAAPALDATKAAAPERKSPAGTAAPDKPQAPPEAKPAPAPTPEPVAEDPNPSAPATETEPEPKAKPKAKIKPKQKAKPKAKIKPKQKAKPKAKVRPRVKPKAKPKPKPVEQSADRDFGY